MDPFSVVAPVGQAGWLVHHAMRAAGMSLKLQYSAMLSVRWFWTGTTYYPGQTERAAFPVPGWAYGVILIQFCPSGQSFQGIPIIAGEGIQAFFSHACRGLSRRTKSGRTARRPYEYCDLLHPWR
jgi:hypothetical protein